MKAKSIILVHRWDGTRESDWYPWFDAQATARGFSVTRLAMPNPERPVIDAWVSAISSVIDDMKETTILLGHSVGCQTILRYFAQEQTSGNFAGALFVAPWLTLQHLETEEERAIAKPWLETPIDFSVARTKAKNFFAIFSDDDPFVDLENRQMFAEKLGAETTVIHGAGHFTDEEGVTQLPEVLEYLEKMNP